ncbi:MAG: class B sortase [Lachnospiraceae bacterium]|nr:class B sortase [Lachnospiraceae bacterium]
MKKKIIIAAALFATALVLAGAGFYILNRAGFSFLPFIESIAAREAAENESMLPVDDPLPDETIPVPLDDEDDAFNIEETDSDKPKAEKPEPVRIPNPYKEKFLENEDMVGWLTLKDSPIDCPVMWTPENEEKYLHMDFNGNYSVGGCLLLDTDSALDPLTTNLIIHGHNMGNGTMFGTLSKFESEEYMEKHKFFHLHTKDYDHRYKVMAVFRSKVFYVSDECFKYYKFFEAKDEKEFEDFYNNVKEMSLYDTGVEAKYGDKFLTLSTCSYHTQNGRFVVVCKEIDPGDYYEAFENE